MKIGGDITATTLDLTENGYNGAHNDTNGNMVLDNIKGYFFSNDTRGDFYITTFSNDGEVLVNNSIKTDVTNNTSGVITYNGTEAISGDLQNAGTVIVTSGNLKITDGRLTVQGTSSQLLGANETHLQSLEVVDDGIEIGSSWQSGSLIVDGIITTKFVNNHSTVQSNNLQITGDMDDEDVYGGTNYSGATMLISNSISLANGSLLNNKGNVLFVGESAQISGNGIINNLLDNNVTTNALSVVNEVNVGEGASVEVEKELSARSLNISDGGSVEAGSLQLNDGQGTITLGGAVTNDDGTISAARLNIDGDIVAASLSSGEGSAVTVGEDSKITVSGALVAGGSIDADEITAKTITGGASSSINAATVKAGETMSIDGAIDAASVAAKTLLTGADSSLTADTVNATIASIGGTADVGALTMSDNSTIIANGGSLNADEITANNSNIIANGGKVDAGTITANELAINTTGNAQEQVVIDTLVGDGLTLNVDTLEKNQVVIGTYTGESVSVIGSSTVTDNLGNDLTSIEAGMQNLADTLNIKSDDAVKELLAEEGNVLGKITGTVDANGNLTVTGEDMNSFNQGVSEMASIALTCAAGRARATLIPTATA